MGTLVPAGAYSPFPAPRAFPEHSLIPAHPLDIPGGWPDFPGHYTIPSIV